MASVTLEQALTSAIRLQQAGRLDEAERIYRQILAQHADCADAEHLLGILRAQRGQPAEGIELIRRAIERNPGVPSFHINLGNVYFSLGRIDEAMDCYRRGLAIRSDFPEAWANLASALNERGQFEEGLKSARKALELRPDFVEGLVVCGNSLHSLGRLDEAIEEFKKAVALKPEFAEAHNNLGLCLLARRRFEEALEELDRVAALRPTWGAGWSNRAKVLRHQGRPEAAESAARRAVELEPNLAEAHVNLAGALLDLGRIDDALASARRAVQLGSTMAQTHNILANVLKEAGKITEAVDEFDRAAELDPDNSIDLSNKLYAMEFDPRWDARQLLHEQQKWDARFGQPLKKFHKPFDNDRSPHRRIRVGYVSPYFHAHAESFFVVPLIESHDHDGFEIHCYSDSAIEDDVTARLKRTTDAWHPTGGMTADEMAEQIRADRIDILVDLTMHMAFNRALVFARKPAPVQVAWLAYPGGTGMQAMDYRISDGWIDPVGSDESVYRERTLRMPSTWACYDPMSDAAVAQRREPGPIRFGSLNNPCKLNEPVLRLWARILKATEDSQLILQSVSQQQRSSITQLLQTESIAAERIEFVGRMKRPEYLRLYDRIDVALDPFPYNGITTTLDALWMGVPAVSLAGRTATGRAGASILANCGKPQWVAESQQDYVRIATELAGRVLENTRPDLREELIRSPLMNGNQFARDMETAYRQMWADWCGNCR